MVMEWLGHSDSKMVKHYYHLQDEESQRRMNQIDSLGGASNRFARRDQGPHEEGSDQKSDESGS